MGSAPSHVCSIKKEGDVYGRQRKREIQSKPAFHAPFASSRSLNFWIFPVLVFGTSPNTTWRGTL